MKRKCSRTSRAAYGTFCCFTHLLGHTLGKLPQIPQPCKPIVAVSTRLQAAGFGLQPLELDLQAEWARVTGEPPGLPQAGVICRRELAGPILDFVRAHGDG